MSREVHVIVLGGDALAERLVRKLVKISPALVVTVIDSLDRQVSNARRAFWGGGAISSSSRRFRFFFGFSALCASC
jgi:hypothetical protein